jgi:N6-L-threonylcarbamoyladenine synthase
LKEALTFRPPSVPGAGQRLQEGSSQEGCTAEPGESYILGIETSCDETAAAVVGSSGSIRSQVVASQLDVHQRYGGVVPELASREHLRAIVPVVRAAMSEADLRYQELAAVAVTAGPGLMGALLVGLTYAKGIALATGVPLLGVNHLEGHIQAVLLEARQQSKQIDFPALALIVSGGHTHLFYADEAGSYRMLGRTRDDAIGEAYDKVAVNLGYPYPGGPVLDAIAAQGRPRDGVFAVPSMKGNPLDFSFSGFKTAARRWRESQPGLEDEIGARRALALSHPGASLEEWLALTPPATRDIIATFQSTALTHVEANCRLALRETDARSVIVSGGVASNRELRARLRAPGFPAPCYFPTPSLSTDNAVMIACAGFARLARGESDPMDLSPEANLRLDFPRESLA